MNSRKPLFFMLICSIALISMCKSAGITNTESELKKDIDSLIKVDSIRSFNGLVLIAQNDSILYFEASGYSNFENKSQLTQEHQFVIGSLSKQITAVLVLQAFEKGYLKLNDPIGKYLLDLPVAWRDSITIHQLLNHTHGISALDKPLNFKPGSDFAYSNLGYELLGKILEKVSDKTFDELCTELFVKCGMKNTCVPDSVKISKLAEAWSKDSLGNIVAENETFTGSYVPAAYIISTIGDLLIWNSQLYNEKLLTASNFNLMTKPTAEQNHPLFGKVGYGYALRINNADNLPEIGHTGYVPGYLSMNYYYPNSKTSLIVLENLDWKDDNIKNTFCYELKISEIVRKWLLKGRRNNANATKS